MNKNLTTVGTFKGALVGVAGVALLAGGYGTFALWTDTEAAPDGGVVSGNLDIVAGTTTVWDDLSTTAPGDWNNATDHVVPGDEITMTKTFTISSKGKNMKSKLTFTPGVVTKGTVAAGGFGDYLTVTTAVSGLPATTGPANEWTFTTPTAPTVVTVKVTFKFDAAATGQEAQDASASITAGQLVFEQIA